LRGIIEYAGRLAAGAAVSGLCVATPVAGQSLDDIMARYIEARGGLEAIRSVTTIRMKGTMTSGPGNPVPVVIEMKRPAMMRMDMIVDGAMGTQAFDGTEGWVVMPFAGITTPDRMPPDVAREARAQADFDGPLVDHASKGHRVELAGRGRVNGKDTFELLVTLRDGSRRTIHLDATTFLEIRSSGTRSAGGAPIEHDTTMSDYRKVGGLMFPHAIETGLTNAPQRQRLVIDSIEINVPIADDRFRMPGGLI
jgi:hypothetical protein